MYLVLYTEDYQKDPLATKIVYEADTQNPILFSDEVEAHGWASRCLGGLPYQIINTDNFKKCTEPAKTSQHVVIYYDGEQAELLNHGQVFNSFEQADQQAVEQLGRFSNENKSLWRVVNMESDQFIDGYNLGYEVGKISVIDR